MSVHFHKLFHIFSHFNSAVKCKLSDKLPYIYETRPLESCLSFIMLTRGRERRGSPRPHCCMLIKIKKKNIAGRRYFCCNCLKGLNTPTSCKSLKVCISLLYQPCAILLFRSYTLPLSAEMYFILIIRYNTRSWWPVNIFKLAQFA